MDINTTGGVVMVVAVATRPDHPFLMSITWSLPMQDLNVTTANPTPPAQPVAIGALKRLKILCISEVGWLDNATLLGDIAAAGGMSTNQYQLPWPPFGELHADNAAGSSALIEAETADGKLHRVLFDTGWNPTWMERRFAEEGVDRLLGRDRDDRAGMAELVDQVQPLLVKTFGDIDWDSRAVFQGNADPPEMIEVFVTDDETLDSAVRQQPVHALLGEAALHPGGIPTGIEQHPVQLAIRRFRFDQRR